MRKTILFLGVLMVAVFLGGCSSGTDLSEKENDSLAEYMAGSLLKHDKNYDQAFTYEEAQESASELHSEEIPPADESPEPSSEPDVPAEPSAGETSSGDTKKAASCELWELYEVDGIKISYDSASICDSYPKGASSSYYSVGAKKKHKLVVLKFNVRNSKNKKVMLNLLESGISYQLKTEDGGVYQPLITLVVEDLQYLDYYVAKNGKDQAVLIFEVPEKVKTNGAVFCASKENKACEITVK
ncbi:MAG: hypothetical protein PUB10_06050 [Clostridiales bacterium]|nr:hypothetical protein [Clostridiales bacterium]